LGPSWRAAEIAGHFGMGLRNHNNLGPRFPR
jgi:hypothetical protein